MCIKREAVSVSWVGPHRVVVDAMRRILPLLCSYYSYLPTKSETIRNTLSRNEEMINSELFVFALVKQIVGEDSLSWGNLLNRFFHPVLLSFWKVQPPWRTTAKSTDSSPPTIYPTSAFVLEFWYKKLTSLVWYNRGCHRAVLVAVDGFSVIGSEFAVHGFMEIAVAKLNYANRARTVITPR